MLSSKAIADFKVIYKKEFGVELSDAEAQEHGVKLLRLFKMILQPIPKQWVEEKLKAMKGGGESNGNK